MAVGVGAGAGVGVEVAVETAGVVIGVVRLYRGILARSSSNDISSGGCMMREAAPVDVTNGLAGEDVLLPARPVGGALIVTVLQLNFQLYI